MRTLDYRNLNIIKLYICIFKFLLWIVTMVQLGTEFFSTSDITAASPTHVMCAKYDTL